MATKAKKFDAIEMSRQLRQATSRKLHAMNREQQITYFKKVADQYRAEIKIQGEPVGTRS